MNRQTTLLIIFVLVLGAVGYVWYRYSSPLLTETAQKRETSFVSRLSDLQRLKNLQLDVSLFQDPLFKTLLTPDGAISGQILEQTKAGRGNPFIPF